MDTNYSIIIQQIQANRIQQTHIIQSEHREEERWKRRCERWKEPTDNPVKLKTGEHDPFNPSSHSEHKKTTIHLVIMIRNFGHILLRVRRGKNLWNSRFFKAFLRFSRCFQGPDEFKAFQGFSRFSKVLDTLSKRNGVKGHWSPSEYLPTFQVSSRLVKKCSSYDPQTPNIDDRRQKDR